MVLHGHVREVVTDVYGAAVGVVCKTCHEDLRCGVCRGSYYKEDCPRCGVKQAEAMSAVDAWLDELRDFFDLRPDAGLDEIARAYHGPPTQTSKQPPSPEATKMLLDFISWMESTQPHLLKDGWA